MPLDSHAEPLAALLRDALERAASGALGAAAAEAAGRLELRVGDASRLLAPAGDVSADVVYLDPMFGLGGLAAFASAFLCVRWLLRYISTHDFTIFAWYRIVFGILVLVTAHFDLVNWAH